MTLTNKIITHIALFVDDPSKNVPMYIFAKQYDYNSRNLSVSMFDGTGQINISGVVQLNATLPSGNKVFIAGSAQPNGTAIFELNEAMLSEIGTVECDISMYDSVGESPSQEPAMLTSSSFYIVVDAASYGEIPWHNYTDSGYNTSTIQVPITENTTDSEYRCVVSCAEEETLTSSGAKIIESSQQHPQTPTEGPRGTYISIDSNPVDYYGQIGDTAEFSVGASKGATVSGDPASFNDGLDFPVDDLSATIVGVQGEAGSGKNILNIHRTVAVNTTSTQYNYKEINSGDTSGLYAALSALPKNIELYPNYTMKRNGTVYTDTSGYGAMIRFMSGSTITAELRRDGTSSTNNKIPTSATWSSIRIYTFTKASGTKEISEVQVGKSRSDVMQGYNPYNTYGPLSGFSSVNISNNPERYDSSTNTDGYYYDDNLDYVQNNNVVLTDYISINNAIDVNIGFSGTSSSAKVRVNWFDSSKSITHQDAVYVTSQDISFDVPSEAAFVRISVNPSVTPISSVKVPVDVTVQLGRTVYGGSLDVTTGTLVVTHGYFNASDVTWSMTGGDYPFFVTYSLSNVELLQNWSGVIQAKSNIYIATDGNAASDSRDCVIFGSPNESVIRVRDSHYPDATTFKNNCGATFMYKLSHSLVYHIDPVEIKTIFGSNSFSSDSGAVSVTYRSSSGINYQWQTRGGALKVLSIEEALNRSDDLLDQTDSAAETLGGIIDTLSSSISGKADGLKQENERLYLLNNGSVIEGTETHVSDNIFDYKESGNPVYIYTPFANDAIKDIEIGIEATQNLNWRDKPWSKCGNINKLIENFESGSISSTDGSNIDNSSSIRSVEFSVVSPSTNYYLVVPSGTTINVAQYRSDKSFIKVGTGVTSSAVFTTNAECYYIRLIVNKTSYGNNISFNYPSTNHSYSPSANVCQIDGHSSAIISVDDCGKNLLDIDADRTVSYSTTSRYITVSASSNQDLYYALASLPRNVTLYVKYEIKVNGEIMSPDDYVIYFYQGASSLRAQLHSYGGIIPSDAVFDRARIYSLNDTAVSKQMSKFRVGLSQSDVEEWTPHSGENLFNFSQSDWVSNKRIDSNGDIVTNNALKYTSSYFTAPQPGKYVASYDKHVSNNLGLTIALYDKNKAWLETLTALPATTDSGVITGSFEFPSGASYCRIASVSNGTTNIRIERADQLTGLSLTSRQYTVGFNNNTVYGGTLNVTTGDLTITHVLWTIQGTETWYIAASSYIKSDAIDAYNMRNNAKSSSTGLCTHASYVDPSSAIWSTVGYPNTFTFNGYQLHINIPLTTLGVTDYTQETTTTALTKFKAFLAEQYANNTPVRVLYELATPTTVQLSPTQITNLLGNNRIYTDVVGDVTLQYYSQPTIEYGAQDGTYRMICTVSDDSKIYDWNKMQ